MGGLESKIQSYIHTNDLDIEYKGSTVENIWGTKYGVVIEESDHCLDLSMAKYFSREIVLKTPCNASLQNGFFENEAEALTKTLAHEMGHTESYGVTSALLCAIGTAGLIATIARRNPLYFLATVGGMVGCKCIVDELLAESVAYFIHGTSIVSPNSDFGSGFLEPLLKLL